MLRGAVQITASSVRYSVVTSDRSVPGTVTAGFRELATLSGDPEEAESAVAEGVEAARMAGAEVVQLLAAPELKGTRLASRLRIGSRKLGTGDVVFTGGGAAIAASFIASTASLQSDAGPVEESVTCGVLGLGDHSVGLAVGRPGERPSWIGSRPVGLARLAERSRLSDPPEPSQLAAARSAVERALGSFSAPAIDRLVSVSDFSLATRIACGERVDRELLSGTLDDLIGMTADQLGATVGLGPRLARLFPLALVAQLAAVGTFGVDLVPLDPDPAGLGSALGEVSGVGT